MDSRRSKNRILLPFSDAIFLPDVKDRLATGILDRGVQMLRRARALDPRLRPLPDFIILGAQKAGTSSLHALIAQHPEVRPPLKKEIHYFDLHHNRGERWYRSFFPAAKEGFITGEASPYYLFHPLCPKRIQDLIPDARLIVVLRDPVKRAISQFHHEVRLGLETRPFAEALAAEQRMLDREHEVVLAGGVSFEHQHHSYRARGVYADQIAAFLDRFGRDNLLVLESGALYRDPVGAARATFEFLGVDPKFTPSRLAAKNVGTYRNEIAPDTIAKLVAYYEPHNRRLFDLIGIEFDWS